MRAKKFPKVSIFEDEYEDWELDLLVTVVGAGTFILFVTDIVGRIL